MLKNFRKELWNCVKDSFKKYSFGGYSSLEECGFCVKQQASFFGRGYANRVIGTTLLTKGLEYDHVVIVEKQEFDDKNFYVAISRACKSITFIDLVY